MDSAKLNDWMQVIGIFAVVASLIFVGLQMRQDQEIAISLASQARTDTTIQSLAATASNPFFMSAVDKIANDEIELLLPSEKRAVAMYGVQLIMIFENIHFQYLNGFVGEERSAGAKESLKTALKRRAGAARTIYDNNPAAWRESFQDVVDSLINEIDSESTSGANQQPSQ